MAAAAPCLVCYLCIAMVCNSHRVIITLCGAHSERLWGVVERLWRSCDLSLGEGRGGGGVEVAVHILDLTCNHGPK